MKTGDITAMIVPMVIEEIIQDFDTCIEPFTVMDVSTALNAGRAGLENTPPEHEAAWYETLAFELSTKWNAESPWDTYFAPFGSFTDEAGNIVYCPDIANANPSVINHWEERAKTLMHPVLVARYADLVWEFGPMVAKSRRDPEVARLAIDAYFSCGEPTVHPKLHDRIKSVIRGFDLACFIKARDRIEFGRDRLMLLQAEAVGSRDRWWLVFDRLINDRNAGLTKSQEQELIQGLEGVVTTVSNPSDPETFNPHDTESAAGFLIRYYRRKEQPDEIRRLQQTVAETFVHFAGLGDPMVAASALQTAVNAWHDAGMTDESQRARGLMEEQIRASCDAMGEVSTEIRIPLEDVEKFCAAVVVDDLSETFAKLAVHFLANRKLAEDILQQSLKKSPLIAMIPQKIMEDDHVAATVGSIKDDPEGQILRQAVMNFQLRNFWLHKALEHLMEVHNPFPDHFVGWANRYGIFEDMTFLREGVISWFGGDHHRAVHLLVPQVERGLRGIVKNMDMPVTRAHPHIKGASVALSMGDMLYRPAIADRLGPNLTLHFRTIYADPRGRNLRNSIAHGLMKPEHINQNVTNLVMHSFLVFGVWKELADRDGQ